MGRRLYFTTVTVGGAPVWGAHVLAETAAEARGYALRQFITPFDPAELRSMSEQERAICLRMEARSAVSRQAAREGRAKVEARPSKAALSQAING